MEIEGEKKRRNVWNKGDSLPWTATFEQVLGEARQSKICRRREFYTVCKYSSVPRHDFNDLPIF